LPRGTVAQGGEVWKVARRTIVLDANAHFDKV
jgi:hypothetical protein